MSPEPPHQVTCPICGNLVDASKINTHLDANCAMEPLVDNMPLAGQSPLASVFTRSVKSDKEPTAPLKNSHESPTLIKSTEVASIFKKTTIASPDDEAARKRRTSVDQPLPSTPTVKRARKEALAATMPLAAKVRPQTLDGFVGQEELVGKNGLLRRLIKADKIPSMVLWGGPGCGKTTLARIISKTTRSRFVELSATSHGAADVKKAFDEARGHLSLTGQPTIIFIDEIHRFTKVQQDLFLPYVEQGQITLIGATTENPSFKVNGALLSRCRVFVLKQLTMEEITSILGNALTRWRQLDSEPPSEDTPISDSEKEALAFLANFSDGDARSALNTLEIALNALDTKEDALSKDAVKNAFQKSHLLYDRNGEEHYNIISAMHKSIRGSDADAALYWLGRMFEAGEDPLYIARRLVRCASEDIGLADNHALPLAVAAYTACEKIGYPECNVILAQAVVYLAEAKKSVRVYKAYGRVRELIANAPAYPVPLHIRNAPTKLMSNLGYGQGYKYNPDFDGPIDQTYLPEPLLDKKFLDP
ncbi:P-loop containing nucleoside triphosphate hydrolase protein [Hesseltinella vesiculosa]|uniref:P-loop containing nucleoside triphosphate hydrolase protein n=1 Tax=Hesseltinella vesiculosa TaxID=101127 RepID=A0A1X2G7K7_9FUNG|nr:P-loop containing nucleoside triphosphate hydrolase protein [Hesseltinella vesiculosa]